MTKKIAISQVDTVFVNGSYPIEFLFYYKHHLKTEHIRKALRTVVNSFWPVFGTYADGYIHFDGFSEANFLDVIIAPKNFDMKCDAMEIWEDLNNINSDRMKSLFFLTIIQYKNGTVLIPKLNHLAGDGYSYFFFLSILAALSRPALIPLKKYITRLLTTPHHNRTALTKFHFSKTNIEAPIIHQDCKIHLKKITRTSISEQIRKIDAAQHRRVSANDILAAMIVKHTLAMQTLTSPENLILSIPIDIRRHIRLYGSKFFGNGLLLHDIKIDLARAKKAEIAELAKEIRQAMPVINESIYLDYLNRLDSTITESGLHQLRPYDPDRGCLVTNLTRLPAHRLDFGSGHPDFIFLLTLGKNSAAILANKDEYILRLVY